MASIAPEADFSACAAINWNWGIFVGERESMSGLLGRTVVADPREGCPPSTHVAPEPMDTGMTRRLVEELKQQIAAEVAAQVVDEMRNLAKILRDVGPDAVTKPIACVRLGIGMTKLKGMIRCREISVCVIGGKVMIPTEEIRRLTRPVHPASAPKRGGGRKKTATYDPQADFEALGRRKKR